MTGILLWLSLMSVSVQQSETEPRVPQFVLLSFDIILPQSVASEKNQFVRLRQAWKKYGDARFTVFFNSAQLTVPPRSSPKKGMTEEEKARWALNRAVPPGNHQKVSWAKNLEVLSRRVETLKKLDTMGVELASHGVRHLRGGDWRRKAWLRDLKEHEAILKRHNLPMPEGYRAPHLDFNGALLPALSKLGYRYDASRGIGRRWPTQFSNSVWKIGIPHIEVPEVGKVLLFDLKMHATLSVLTQQHRKKSEKLYYRSLYDEFLKRYRGRREPLSVAGHGAYFIRPLTKFVRKVCGLEDVRCVTHRELVQYLEGSTSDRKNKPPF